MPPLHGFRDRGRPLRQFSDMRGEKFDFIVVGAGSAGCALAARIADRAKFHVLLLEAGPRDTSPWIHIPIGYGKTMFSPKVNWCSTSAPIASLNNRSIYCPRGKVLGGGSSINGLLYVRGQKEDFDHWAALGNPSWGWEDVLPYFLRLEDHYDGRTLYHDVGGPMRVSPIESPSILARAFVQSAIQAGLPRNVDFNGETQEGAGYFDLTTKRGRRVSTATAYLGWHRRRGKLSVKTAAVAKRILVRDGVAAAVVYDQGGREHVAYAAKEVFVSAGAIGSPALLQLSGIGDPELLAARGIATVLPLPGVGRNLQDHLRVRLTYRCSEAVTTNDDLSAWYRKAKVGLRYAFFRDGPMAVGINQAGAFARTDPGLDRPDVQFMFGTFSADLQGGKIHPFSGFTLALGVLRPESRGYVRIKSDDPYEDPEIQPNYLATEYDRVTLLKAIRLGQSIVSTPPLSSFIEAPHAPDSECRTDDQLLKFVRAYANGLMHPCGTCRMGADPMSVVDGSLRVHGVPNLRVVDASVMPAITLGNINVPTIMIAEKISDQVVARHV